MTDQATRQAPVARDARDRPPAGTSPGTVNSAKRAPASSSSWVRPGGAVNRTDAMVAALLFLDALLVMALTRVAQLLPEPASPLVSVAVLAGMTAPLALRLGGWRARTLIVEGLPVRIPPSCRGQRNCSCDEC